jgi:hypothetical protein
MENLRLFRDELDRQLDEWLDARRTRLAGWPTAVRLHH